MSQQLSFQLTDEYIELVKLLKLLNICSSGGEAKMVIEEGLISCNGEVEYRKRKKLRKGDQIKYENYSVTIT